MQNDADPTCDLRLTPEALRQMVLALGVHPRDADLDAALPAAEVLRRKARAARALE